MPGLLVIFNFYMKAGTRYLVSADSHRLPARYTAILPTRMVLHLLVCSILGICTKAVIAIVSINVSMYSIVPRYFLYAVLQLKYIL